MKKKVVMFYSLSFQPYQGWYLRAYNEAKTLVDAGYDVTLLAWDRECRHPLEEIVDGIQVKRFRLRAGIAQGPRSILKILKYNLAIFRYLMKNDFDIVHCFNIDAMACGLLSARMRGAKAVLDLCEPEYYRGFWDEKYSFLLHIVDAIERIFSIRYDHLFVHNTYQIEKFHSYGMHRLTQVGSYPNRSMMRPKAKRSRDNELVIGRLGTIYAKHGFEEVIQAFRHLLAKQEQSGSPVRYKLFLAGHVFDAYRDELDALVRSLGEHVEIEGAYQPSDLSRLYGKIDLSILLYDGHWLRHVTPTKLFESLANGVPVVASAIGDMPRIVREEECGVIVDEKDPRDICLAIEKLAADMNLRDRMAQNALTAAEERYTWEACRERFLAAYQSLS